MAPRKEKREVDGEKYTWDEFVEFYGEKKAAKKWDAAEGKAGGKAAAGSDKPCTVCGKTNHKKADCKHKDKECSNCGKVGHLSSVCRQEGGDTKKKRTDSTASDTKACTVCGKTNHLRADCKLKDKECSNCGKVGHIAKVCRQAGGGAEKDGAAGSTDKACSVCGKVGHLRAECKLKDKECSNCGKVGHIVKTCRAPGGGAEKESKTKTKGEGKGKAKGKAKAPRERSAFKVCVCGGAGGIGQPLSLLMAMDSNVKELNVFDLNVAMVPPEGVAADLGHLEKGVKVKGFVMEVGKNPVDHLEECLTGCDLVLIPAGMPRKPGMSRDDLFKVNADIAKGLVEACGKWCPDAMVALIVNPVNSIVPAMAELYAKKGLDPKKLVGVTTLDCVRANKFVGDITGKNPNFIKVPVVGGHAGATILPLFSQDKVASTIDADKIADLDKRVQDAGTEVVNAKGGKGSATLSMAYAGARLGKSILAGLSGRRRTECAYVKSDAMEGFEYFTSKVVFGDKGVAKVLPIGDLNEHETKRMEEVKAALKTEIETGVAYAKNNDLNCPAREKKVEDTKVVAQELPEGYAYMPSEQEKEDYEMSSLEDMNHGHNPDKAPWIK